MTQHKGHLASDIKTVLYLDMDNLLAYSDKEHKNRVGIIKGKDMGNGVYSFEVIYDDLARII